jgi:hypothetical protein
MSSAGIFEQSMGARNRVGIGLSYQPPGYIAWRNWFLGINPWLLKILKIRAHVNFRGYPNLADAYSTSMYCM